MTHDVFISYSSHDQKIVEGLSAYLEQNGIRCFVAYRDIPRGVVWAAAITEAIENCQMMVVVFSDNFNNAIQVDREIEICAEENKPILTFKLTNHQFKGAKRFYLTNINWIDAFPNPKKSFGKLLESIKRLIDNTPQLIETEEEVVTVIKEEPKIVVKLREPEIKRGDIPKPPLPENKRQFTVVRIFVAVFSVLFLAAVFYGIDRTIKTREKKRQELALIAEADKERQRKIDDANRVWTADQVTINGVVWSTRNVNSRGSFVANAWDYGNYYTLEGAQDACPAGWRTPTKDEFVSLDNSGSEWTSKNGISGRIFGSGGNRIFLPAAGYRNPDGTVNDQYTNGRYWSSEPHNSMYHHSLNPDINYTNRCTLGFTVRCVSQ